MGSRVTSILERRLIKLGYTTTFIWSANITDSESQRRVSLKTVFTAVAFMALAATVAFLQISEHRAPRPAYADQYSMSSGITSGAEDSNPINLTTNGFDDLAN